MQNFVWGERKFAFVQPNFIIIFFMDSFALSRRFSVCGKRDVARSAILVVSATDREL